MKIYLSGLKIFSLSSYLIHVDYRNELKTCWSFPADLHRPVKEICRVILIPSILKFQFLSVTTVCAMVIYEFLYTLYSIKLSVEEIIPASKFY